MSAQLAQRGSETVYYFPGDRKIMLV